MKTYPITLLPGDGIGPEVMKAAVTVLESTGLSFSWDVQELIADSDGLLPDTVVNSILKNRIALKGPTATPLGSGHKSLNVQLRTRFELFANLRPIRTVRGKTTRFSDVPIDIVIFRENTEGEYVGHEDIFPDRAEGRFIFTKMGCERIARYAFDYARRNGRKKVTVVHKSNIFKGTHGLFLKTAQAVARDYPDVACDDLIADNCMQQLVMRPERFDCILTTNLVGDLLSDLCAGLVGGLGFAPGFNVGSDVAIAEATHGTAPDIAGKNLANPSSLILSSALLLDHLNERAAADEIRRAVNRVVEQGRDVTADVNPVSHVGTQEFAAAVGRAIRANAK